MSNITETYIPPTTETSKSQGVDYIRTKAEEMDYCYTLLDKIFQLSLGKNAHFSGARYMGDFSMSLAEAQAAKCDYVAQMLGVKKGTRLIDLGCGWGGFLRHVTDKYGVEGVGVTLSQGQAKHCQETGLNVHCQDLREVKPETFGPFEVATAFGSFEHLCSYEEYLEGKMMDIYRNYFDQVAELIPVGKRFYMQTMTFGKKIIPRDTWDINAPKESDEFIMALMVSWFSRGTPAFPLFALSGLAMIPATLAHGGHHLMDLFGGVVIFATLLWAASRLLPDTRPKP